MTDQAWPGKNKGQGKGADDLFFFSDKLKDDEPKTAQVEEPEEESLLDDKPLFAEGQSIFADDIITPPKKQAPPPRQQVPVPKPQPQRQQPAAEPIRIQCDICRKIMVIPATYQGKVGKCPKCGNIVKISQTRPPSSRSTQPPEPQGIEIKCYICSFNFAVMPGEEEANCPQCFTTISIEEAQKRGRDSNQTPRTRMSSSPRFKSRQARMTVMEVVETSFEWTREDFISFFLIMLISLAFSSVTQVLQRSWGEAAQGQSSVLGIMGLLSWLSALLGQAAIAAAIACKYLRRKIRVSECYLIAIKKIPQIIAAGILVILAYIGVAGILVLFFFLVRGGIGMIISLIFVFAIFALYMLPYWFYVYAIILEQKGPIAALRRCAELYSHQRFRVICILMLMSLALAFYGFLMGIITAYLVFLGNPYVLSTVDLIFSAIIAIPSAIMYVVIFIDLKARENSLDMQQFQEIFV